MDSPFGETIEVRIYPPTKTGCDTNAIFKMGTTHETSLMHGRCIQYLVPSAFPYLATTDDEQSTQT